MESSATEISGLKMLPESSWVDPLESVCGFSPLTTSSVEPHQPFTNTMESRVTLMFIKQRQRRQELQQQRRQVLQRQERMRQHLFIDTTDVDMGAQDGGDGDVDDGDAIPQDLAPLRLVRSSGCYHERV